jgi:hypothetical protein
MSFLRSFAAAEVARLRNGMVFHPVNACMPEEFNEYLARTSQDGQGGVMLLNTCRALEDEFIDVEAESPEYAGMKIFAMGPLNPLLDGSARMLGQVAGAERVPGLARQATAGIGGVRVVRHQTGHQVGPLFSPLWRRVQLYGPGDESAHPPPRSFSGKTHLPCAAEAKCFRAMMPLRGEDYLRCLLCS